VNLIISLPCIQAGDITGEFFQVFLEGGVPS